MRLLRVIACQSTLKLTHVDHCHAKTYACAHAAQIRTQTSFCVFFFELIVFEEKFGELLINTEYIHFTNTQGICLQTNQSNPFSYKKERDASRCLVVLVLNGRRFFLPNDPLQFGFIDSYQKHRHNRGKAQKKTPKLTCLPILLAVKTVPEQQK